VDLRGHGHSSVRPRRSVDFSYTDLLNHEYTSVLNHVGASLADKRIFLFGHSLGGQLSCLFASRNTHRIDGIILSATCSVYYKGWPGLSAYRILLGTQFAGLVASIVGYFPGDKVGFGGKEARSLMRDWSRQARTGRYVLENDPFDYEQTLKTVTIPLLAISYQADTFAPVEAVDHLLDKMPAAEKQHIHLKDSDPRNEGFSHFNWAKRPKNVVTVVSQWINSIP